MWLISPEQKQPARGREGNRREMAAASWWGLPKSSAPRPLQVQSTAATEPLFSLVQHERQVKIGRGSVAHLELDGLPDSRGVADRNRAGDLIGAGQVTNQVVAAGELGPVFIDC
jgi:hypothetical protein